MKSYYHNKFINLCAFILFFINLWGPWCYLWLTYKTSQFLGQCFIWCLSKSEDTLILKSVQAKKKKKVNLLFHITENSRDKFSYQENWIKDQKSVSVPQFSCPVLSPHLQRDSPHRAASDKLTHIMLHSKPSEGECFSF